MPPFARIQSNEIKGISLLFLISGKYQESSLKEIFQLPYTGENNLLANYSFFYDDR